MGKKLRIGFHVSIQGGIENSVTNAVQLQCSAFQIFTRSPRRWAAKDIEESEARLFKERLAASKIEKEAVAVHMPYLPNLATSNPESYTGSVQILSDEVTRCAFLGIRYLIIHLGNHGDAGAKAGVHQLAAAIDTARDRTENVPKARDVMILLENSAGQKNSLGSRFEELQTILDKISDQGAIGVCLDTCHTFAGGYDISTIKGVEEMVVQFDKHVGLKRLRWIHLNDSKDPLLSHRDRHEHIGRGKIGLAGMKAFLGSAMADLAPIVMETPKKAEADDAMNMATVKSMM